MAQKQYMKMTHLWKFLKEDINLFLEYMYSSC